MGRTAHPPELRARAVELRALGNSINGIGRTLGVGANTVRRWVDPEYHEKAKASSRDYKAKAHGICVECGGHTTLLHSGEGFAQRCKWCAEGKKPPAPPDKRRCVPIRLCDLNRDVLLAAAWEANRFEQGDHEKQEILLAAVFPSSRVHWISESARGILDQAAA